LGVSGSATVKIKIKYLSPFCVFFQSLIRIGINSSYVFQVLPSSSV
jgi:hypothetical protein